MIEQIILLIKYLAWPLTVLVIVWLLRKEIRRAFTRIETAKLPGGTEFKLFPYEEKQFQKLQEKKEVSESVKVDGKWENIGNIYWLGHDLMWTIDIILRQGSGTYICHGLRQSVHHLTNLGLDKTPSGESLKRLNVKAQGLLESDWNIEIREAMATDLLRLRQEIGDLISSQQDGFTSS